MRYPLVLGFLSASLLGCANDFTAPSLVDSLRILAVQAEPASGAPGQTSTLKLVVADGALAAQGAAAPRPLQIAWLSGCHNPPTRQFFGCYPELSAVAAKLSPRVLDTPESAVPRAFLGTGDSYALDVPADILSAAPLLAGDSVHFGVSYVFFGVCAGELRARPDVSDRVPLDCVDPSSGAPLDRRDFVTGFSTLFSYEGVTNHNPILSGVRFGSTELTDRACQSDSDCRGDAAPSEAGFELSCGSQNTCVPSLPSCTGDSCPEFSVTPEVDRASAEVLPGSPGTETLWADFYADGGHFDSATQLINDSSAGWVADQGTRFRIPRDRQGSVQLWVGVHDQRGGVALRAFELLLR